MSNIGEILKGIEKNKIVLKAGTEFYYADRNSKKLLYSQREKTQMKYSDAMMYLDTIH